MWLSSRHHHYGVRRKDARLIKTSDIQGRSKEWSCAELSLKWPEYPACTRRSLRWRMSWRMRSEKKRFKIDQGKVQVQDGHLEETICLKLAIYLMFMDMWRYAQMKPFHIKYGKASWVFIKQEQEYTIKKGVPSWGGQDSHHLAQVECARQRYDLDRFYLLLVSWWWWETGFRIDNRTIKRGSRSEYLDRIVQRELKPLHTCHHIFLGS